MVVNGKYFNSVNRIPGSQTIPQSPPKPVQNQWDFGRILEDKINGSNELKFSKHAEMRLKERNIQLTEAQKEKMNQAVRRADEKGVRDSLVLMDNLAFVVNIKNKTVVTAVNSSELKENVFTNIDGAVFA